MFRIVIFWLIHKLKCAGTWLDSFGKETGRRRRNKLGFVDEQVDGSPPVKEREYFYLSTSGR